jgi:hypothetical protein
MRKTWTWLLLGCAATTGACAQILGNDFCRADDPSCPAPPTGTGGQGASGEGGDGGTGGGAALLDCEIVAGSRVEIASLEGADVAHQWNPGLRLVASDDDQLHFAVTRSLAGGPWLEIYRHGSSGVAAGFEGDEILGVAPIDGTQVGVLFTSSGELRLGRSDDTLAETLATATTPPTFLDAGAFAQIPGGDVVFVVSTSDGGDSHALFGRYAGSPVLPVRFTAPDDNLAERDVAPVAIVRQGTQNHVFLGEVGSPNGGRHHTFGDAPATQPPTLQLGQGYDFMRVRGTGPDVDLVIIDLTNAAVVTLRAATLPFADLPSVEAHVLPVTTEVPVSVIPVGGVAAVTATHLGVVGDVGGDPPQARLLVVAFANGIVAQGTLELGAALGELDAIEEVHARPRSAFSSTGRLDAIVMTSHDGGAFKKLHSLEVQCVAP